MLTDNSTAVAELAPEYKEVTIKVMGAPIKSYQFQYSFSVNGIPYQGSESYSKLPDTNTLKIYYLSTDPHINLTNPTDRLRLEKEKNSSKSDLYWGLFWGIVCIACIFGFIQEIRAGNTQS